MADFLQGVQVGANLWQNAQQLAAQRRAQETAALRLMHEIAASRALETYRMRQSDIAEAEEKRQAAEFLNRQNEQKKLEAIPGFYSEELAQRRSVSPFGNEPGMPADDEAAMNRDALTAAMIRGGQYPQAVSLMGQSSREQIDAQRLAVQQDLRIRALENALNIAQMREAGAGERASGTLAQRKAEETGRGERFETGLSQRKVLQQYRELSKQLTALEKQRSDIMTDESKYPAIDANIASINRKMDALMAVDDGVNRDGKESDVDSGKKTLTDETKREIFSRALKQLGFTPPLTKDQAREAAVIAERIAFSEGY